MLPTLARSPGSPRFSGAPGGGYWAEPEAPRPTGRSSRCRFLSRRPRGWCCRAGLASTSRAHGPHSQAGHGESSEPEVGAGLILRLPGPPRGRAAGRAAPVALANFCSREGRGGSKASPGPLTAQESTGQGQRPCERAPEVTGSQDPGPRLGLLLRGPDLVSVGGGPGGSRAAEGRAVDRGGAWVCPGQARWPWGCFSQRPSISQAVMWQTGVWGKGY